MRKVFWQILLASTLLVGAAGAEERLKASSLVKVFLGPNGEKVTVVFLEPIKRDRVLIKFEGVAGDWEGKVILHKRVQDSWSDDYETAVKGERFVSLVGRSRQGVMSYKLYPLGIRTDGIALTYSAEESKKALGTKIVYEFTSPAP